MDNLTRTRKTAPWVGAFAALLFVSASANADTIVFDNPIVQAGTQQDYVLGMDFTVNSTVSVNRLGAFDHLGDGFTGEIKVGIFDLGGTLVGTSATLTGTSGTLIGGSRFVSIIPFLLGPGTYSIVAAGFTGGDWSGNTAFGGVTSFNSAGGAISLVAKGGRWNFDPTSTFQLPTDNSGGYLQPDPVFQAGTFTVPDGGATSMMLGFGVLALGLIRRLIKQ